MAHKMTRREGERGTASIEVTGLSIMVALLVVLALQLFSVIYASQAAGRAAWDAARAQSLGASASAAASASLPGSVSLESVATGGDVARVTVRATQIVPFVELPTITRSAHVP